MFEPISKGVALGLALAFSFGPGFFALINTGIKNGFKPAAFLAFGIFLSDLLLVILTFILLSLGASSFISDEKNQLFIGIIGGIVLIVYGSFNFYNKPPKTDAEASDNTNVNHLNIDTDIHTQAEKVLIKKIPQNNSSPFWMGVKGFFLNLFNPFVWLLWLAAAMGNNFGFSTAKVVVFFSCCLGTVLTFDLLKAFLANKIKHFLTERLMKIINYISGIILIIFGLYIITKLFFLH